MRVIAGTYRSRPLVAPPGMATRPTSDRLRETLFNVVAPLVPDSVFVDLFAGSGAVGIEALSRGARMVYFAEPSRKVAGFIRRNLASLGIEEGFQVLEREAARAVRQLDAEAVECNVCFLDPPYDMHDAYEETLGAIAQSRILGREGIAIAEHVKHFDPGERFGALVRYRRLQQGDAGLSFYRME